MLALAVALALGAFEANGVALGATEREVQARFPSAYCKPLEWKSAAAERRCDDGRVRFGGVRARITFYLRDDAVEAFDVRFDPKDLARLARWLRKAWGAPASEDREIIRREDEPPREVYRARWRGADGQALLTAERAAERASLRVWRGDFEQEIYRIP